MEWGISLLPAWLGCLAYNCESGLSSLGQELADYHKK